MPTIRYYYQLFAQFEYLLIDKTLGILVSFNVIRRNKFSDDPTKSSEKDFSYFFHSKVL